MNRSEYRQLAMNCGYAANLMRQAAHPLAWPEWMTPEKRAEMAAQFERWQIEIDTAVNLGELPPKTRLLEMVEEAARAPLPYDKLYR